MKRLLASHGSCGGVAAENVAIESCRAGDQLDHLYVIPGWWADMTGDDWLNNGSTRNAYRNYLESELYHESERVIERIKNKCKQKNICYRLKLVVGDSAKTLMSLGREYEKVYIGSRRPNGSKGINDRMLTKYALKKLQDQLEIIDYPNGK